MSAKEEISVDKLRDKIFTCVREAVTVVREVVKNDDPASDSAVEDATKAPVEVSYETDTEWHMIPVKVQRQPEMNTIPQPKIVRQNGQGQYINRSEIYERLFSEVDIDTKVYANLTWLNSCAVPKKYFSAQCVGAAWNANDWLSHDCGYDSEKDFESDDDTDKKYPNLEWLNSQSTKLGR